MLPLLTPDNALFLDIDGTLIEFVPHPEDAFIPPVLLDALSTLRRSLGGALAVVSGRKLADIDRLFAPLSFAAGGQHGAEARLAANGDAQVFVTPEIALAGMFEKIEPFLTANPQIRVERKGLSTAFHYRDMIEAGPTLRAILEIAVTPVMETLDLLDSHLCYDVRARGANKGKAVELLMAVEPFAGRVPVYVGDDYTDEDGFKAVLALQGRAIRVGTPRETAATEGLGDPAAVREWLVQSLSALEA